MTIPTPTVNPGRPAATRTRCRTRRCRPACLTRRRLRGSRPSSSRRRPEGTTAPRLSAGSGAVGGDAVALPAAAPILASVSNPVPGGSPLASPGGAGTGVPGLALPQEVPGANLAPSAPTHVLSLGNRAPALAPHAAAQNRLPDNVVSIAPALEPRVGGAALGVPQVNAPVSEGAAKASPYYFTDGSLQGWQATPQDIVVPSNGLASPEAFGLPGDDALRELLAVHRDVPVSRASGGDVPRYFIDDAHAAEPSRKASCIAARIRRST